MAYLTKNKEKKPIEIPKPTLNPEKTQEIPIEQAVVYDAPEVHPHAVHDRSLAHSKHWHSSDRGGAN